MHDFENDCKNAIQHLKDEFKAVRAGRATVDLVDHITVDAYGAKTPLVGVASISISDPKTILISPWDKSVLGAIEKAIQTSGLGINPVNDGHCIRLILPELSEERRKTLVKQIHTLGETTKVSFRTARQKAITDVKAKEVSEDEERRQIEKIDESIKKFNSEIDQIIKVKENDLMNI